MSPTVAMSSIEEQGSLKKGGPPVLEATGDGLDRFRRRFEAYGVRAGLHIALKEAERRMDDRKMRHTR